MGQSCRLPFASTSITEHLLRGALGLVGILSALKLGSFKPILSVALVLGSLVALRGYPHVLVRRPLRHAATKFSRRNV